MITVRTNMKMPQTTNKAQMAPEAHRCHAGRALNCVRSRWKLPWRPSPDTNGARGWSPGRIPVPYATGAPAGYATGAPGTAVGIAWTTGTTPAGWMGVAYATGTLAGWLVAYATGTDCISAAMAAVCPRFLTLAVTRREAIA